ncbi:PQQ-binding-like beta-propeller repeat protein (plasmid) [Marinivivus vitaminiproducens]|nr:PQQ-binding-like beta-propeller repeat protein [Geminicoccaceae bacterium SCSIO 64248]
MVVNRRLIVGSRILDNAAVDEPSGVVRAYDPASGDLIWAWDVGRSEDAIGPLANGEVYTRGTPNVWGAITADPELGMVYLPLGNATPDYYGGQKRPFDDRFSSSVTALDIATGELRWTFQTVHHDVWDFDVPIGPSIVDLPDPNGGEPIPALVQTTKTGQVFVLNRATGKPIKRVEERRVPQTGAVPGERLSPTQPFSTGMPSFTPPPLTPADIWGATPLDQLVCRIQFAQARSEGIYTPPGLQAMIGNPAFDGVTDWGGAAVDPDRKVMTINLMTMPFHIRLVDRDSEEGRGLAANDYEGGENASDEIVYAQNGTPYIALVQAWLGPFGAPCVAPPWGELAAVDLTSGDMLWRRVLGTSRDSGLFGTTYNLPLPTGVPNLGGSVITKSGLVFIGATTDRYLRAFDLRTGEEVWKARLPAGPQATPMIYTGDDGREYVVITAGGHGALGTRYGDYTIAYALPL